MSKKQRSTTVRLTLAKVARVQRLLQSQAIDAYWEAGKDLNGILVGRSLRNGETIEAVGSQLECSSNMIHKLRMFAGLWSKKDVETALR